MYQLGSNVPRIQYFGNKYSQMGFHGGVVFGKNHTTASRHDDAMWIKYTCNSMKPGGCVSPPQHSISPLPHEQHRLPCRLTHLYPGLPINCGMRFAVIFNNCFNCYAETNTKHI